MRQRVRTDEESRYSRSASDALPSAKKSTSPLLSYGVVCIFGIGLLLYLIGIKQSLHDLTGQLREMDTRIAQLLSTAPCTPEESLGDEEPAALEGATQSCAFTLEPRATKAGCQSEHKLECGWSLDAPRTFLVSDRLYDAALAAGASASSGNRGTQLTQMYDSADPGLLKTGIVKLQFPEDGSIHLIPMGGEAYFHRSVRDSNLVMDGFQRVGFLPQAGEHWLDFGGSHGRVAQILAAAFPEATWHVCDPLKDTVEWAATVLPRIEFSVTGQLPPMEQYQANQFSGIYAISIWSHYSESAAIAWLKEMHRILKPGGMLWLSTHGFQAVNFGVLDGAAVQPHREEMVASLYRSGHFYFPMFGQTGDWGNSDGHGGSLWGYGAFTAEWLAANVLNDPATSWRLEYFGPGANERHQDVFVISKR